MTQAGFDPPIARMYSSTECESSALMIQATTAGFVKAYFGCKFAAIKVLTKMMFTF